MLEYIAPGYFLISSLCFSSYATLELSKQKGKLYFTDNAFLLCWCCCSILITFFLYSATKNPELASKSPQALVFLLLFICCTWCISSSSLYSKAR